MELSELIESIDILEYVSQYTEFTEKNGEYWALSPLKDENTPSFSIRREEQSFYDFSSGIGGNVLTFVRFHDGCGYAKAIETLKKYVGYSGDVAPHRKLAATTVAKRFSSSQKQKKSGKTTVLPDDYMQRYEKNAAKLEVWEREGISKASLDKFQVFYDSFSDRLVYPIRNINGAIVNVGGRTLDEEWKAKGLRKYTYFRGWDGGMQVIYGLYENLDAIKNAKCVIIFEGAKSVMLADTYKIKNSAALLTSHLNPQQMKLLIGLGCDVVFALDKDVNIMQDHNIKKLKQYVNVFYLLDKNNLLGEKDSPIDKGSEVFRTLFNERRRYI